jgi:hypothetical protein
MSKNKIFLKAEGYFLLPVGQAACKTNYFIGLVVK